MKTIFLLFFLFYFQVSFSQNKTINKLYIQTSVQKMKFQYKDFNGKLVTNRYNIYQLSLHIQYLDFLESGLYTSFYPYFNTYTYQQKLQLFPLFSERQNFRINTYLSGNIHFSYISDYNILNSSFTFGIGSSFNFNKNWGMFGEYNFGTSYLRFNPHLQFGISYNWSKSKKE